MINPAHARQRDAIATVLVSADIIDRDDPYAEQTYERLRDAVENGADAGKVADILVQPEHLVDAIDPWVLEVSGRVVTAVRS